MGQCPWCDSTNVEEDWDDRQSTPGEYDVLDGECNDCGCQYKLTIEYTYEVLEEGNSGEDR